ncbi:MAG: DUF7121 family protein [Promethearchaeota archaeon]
MSNEKFRPHQASWVSFRELQQQIEEFREKRDELNKKTKYYINKLQTIEEEIENLLKLAKTDYKRKRDYWNIKVQKLKQKKNEYKEILENLLEEKKKLQKNSNIKNNTNNVLSIKQIDKKISKLERIIETENLDISEENSIIDKIRELAELKKKILAEQVGSELFKLEKKIEIVKINLNKIYEQLTKWSNRSQKYHLMMRETYEKINELKKEKERLEEELIENKKAADAFHEKFLRAMNQKKLLSRKNRNFKYRKNVKKPQKFEKKRLEEIEKLKQEQLAIALEKQKAGKKLNLFEARLILEKSKG